MAHSETRLRNMAKSLRRKAKETGEDRWLKQAKGIEAKLPKATRKRRADATDAFNNMQITPVYHEEPAAPIAEDKAHGDDEAIIRMLRARLTNLLADATMAETEEAFFGAVSDCRRVRRALGAMLGEDG